LHLKVCERERYKRARGEGNGQRERSVGEKWNERRILLHLKREIEIQRHNDRER
jgi:hypothetical protein